MPHTIHFSPSSSSISLTTPIDSNYLEILIQTSSNINSLPEELCPASCPPSPRSDARSALWGEKIMEAINAAGAETTHPKWGHVSQLVKLSSTSRGYKSAAIGVRVGEGRKRNAQDYKWVLPETEDGWVECERRWEDRVALGSSPVAREKTKTSKYFQRTTEGHASRALPRSNRAEIARQKVEKWQARIVALAEDDSAVPETRSSSSKVNKGKGRERGTLGFPVVKRSSVPAHNKADMGTTLPLSIPIPSHNVQGPSCDARMRSQDSQIFPNHEHVLPNDTQGPSNAAEVPSNDTQAPSNDVHMTMSSSYVGGHGQIPGVTASVPLESTSDSHPRIDSIPEMSFFPPSFPSQLRTSTPPPTTTRQKPPPIDLQTSPLSSPLSLHSSRSIFDPARPQRVQNLPDMSSSQPPLTSTRKAEKRARPQTPPTENFMMSSQQSLSYQTPPPKKVRLEPAPASSPPPLPPSTPSPSTSAKMPITPLGLGNADRLPIPTSPEQRALPTLKRFWRANARQGDDSEARSAKTFFSSPASGVSDSPQRPRSPVSPLFTQHPATFAPAFVSSQRPGKGADPFSLGRGSSGFFRMGYNSQYDVDAQVDRVNELLERDVDYEGWLQDVPGEDEERPMAQSQSQGGVRVG
ncbi:hypothetical protein A0H81_04963 [Grifola frondosa]|uniref:Uncharacterized protein n=1 Tax=Grifola frondosa TaxID=5627 RepID=A0A1C7MFP4_GRIFR|nr:hypothetical protein A0H81_04963 [Grifola frondosa]